MSKLKDGKKGIDKTESINNSNNTFEYYKNKYKEVLLDDKVETIFYKTGIEELDDLIGGIPAGKVTEIYGHEGSGKSTVCLKMAGYISNSLENHYKGKYVVYIDTESSLFSSATVSRYNINQERCIILCTSDGQKIFEAVAEFVTDDKCALIVIDSVACVVTPEEAAGEEMLGSHARFLSKNMKRIVNTMVESKSQTSLILINQLRSKIGSGDAWKGELNLTTTGGKALKYYASLRLEIQRKEYYVYKDSKIGYVAQVKIIKSRYSSPHDQTLIHLFYEKLSESQQIIYRGLTYGVFSKHVTLIRYPLNESMDSIEKCTFQKLEEIIETNENLKSLFLALIKKNKLSL